MSVLKLPPERARPKDALVPVRLEPIDTLPKYKQLVDAVKDDEEVWQNLNFMEPPSYAREERLAFITKSFIARFIVAGDPDSEEGEHRVGCVVFHMGEWKIHSLVEIDIAIYDRRYRGQKVSLRASALGIDELLYGKNCYECWAWIDKKNAASIGLSQSLGLPIELDGGKRHHAISGHDVETVEFAMTLKQWKKLRPRIKDYMQLPDPPEEQPDPKTNWPDRSD